MHFFTSITNNYLPKARVLAKSIKKHNPYSIFHVVICDKDDKSISLTEEPFDFIHYLEDLDLPVKSLAGWIFQHETVELCTAVKGQFFLKLFQSHGAEKAVFLDPDILVLDSLLQISRLLDQHSILLTPHLVRPEKEMDAITDNEICNLKHGVFNLGFLALRNSSHGLAFATWWRDRLIHFCRNDIPGGLFTDQKWVDLAPALFDGIHIIKDKTYNVATWNLTHRHVEKDTAGQLTIESKPVRFFHFSGFDSGAQKVMLTKYAKDNHALFELRDNYLDLIHQEGHGRMKNAAWGYSSFSNNKPISEHQRQLYRERVDLQEAFKDPFSVSSDCYNYYAWYEHRFRKMKPFKNFLQSIIHYSTGWIPAKRRAKLLESIHNAPVLGVLWTKVGKSLRGYGLL